MTKKLKEENTGLKDLNKQLVKDNLEFLDEINKLRRKKDLIPLYIYIGCAITMIIIMIISGISSEMYDHIDYEPVLNNVGSHICEVHGSERFIDWEDNVLECSDGMIDFNKPVIIYRG